MNRYGEADAFLMFFAFFVIAIMIGGGIFWGVNAFYGKEHDVRAREAALIAERVEKCVMDKDVFADGFDMYGVCGFNEDIIGEDYLIYFSRENVNPRFFGVHDFFTQCGLSDKNILYPRCVSGTMRDVNGEVSYIIGANQHARRIAA